MAELKFSDLEGKGVLTQDGRAIGTVSDMMLTDTEWTVTSLVVKIDRDLLEEFGMKKPMFGTQTVLVSVSAVSGVSDKIILRKAFEEVKTQLAADPKIPLAG